MGTWMKTADACKALGIKQSYLSTMGRSGKIERKDDPNGKGHLYWVESAPAGQAAPTKQVVEVKVEASAKIAPREAYVSEDTPCVDDLLADLAGAEATIEELEKDLRISKEQVELLSRSFSKASTERDELFQKCSLALDGSLIGSTAPALAFKIDSQVRSMKGEIKRLNDEFESRLGSQLREYDAIRKALAEEVDVHIGELFTQDLVDEFARRAALINGFRQEIGNAKEYMSWAFEPFKLDPDEKFDLLDVLAKLAKWVDGLSQPNPQDTPHPALLGSVVNHLEHQSDATLIALQRQVIMHLKGDK